MTINELLVSIGCGVSMFVIIAIASTGGGGRTKNESHQANELREVERVKAADISVRQARTQARRDAADQAEKEAQRLLALRDALGEGSSWNNLTAIKAGKVPKDMMREEAEGGVLRSAWDTRIILSPRDVNTTTRTDISYLGLSEAACEELVSRVGQAFTEVWVGEHRFKSETYEFNGAAFNRAAPLHDARKRMTNKNGETYIWYQPDSTCEKNDCNYKYANGKLREGKPPQYLPQYWDDHVDPVTTNGCGDPDTVVTFTR